MIIFYIIGIFLLLVLSVFIIDKRQSLNTKKNDLKKQREKIIQVNKELDDLQAQLDSIQPGLNKVHDFSQSALKFLSK